MPQPAGQPVDAGGNEPEHAPALTTALTRTPASRNQGIDALRGLSIILVILNHVGIRVPLAKTALATVLPTAFLHDLNYNGYEAVFIFFVISGFLITRRSQERWGDLRAMPPRIFYALRAARIVPCLLLVVALLSLAHLLGVPNFEIHRPGQSLGGAIASALGLYLNWYEGTTGYLPGGWDVLWSLSIEELFYLGFPLVCLSLGRTRLLVPCLILLALSLPLTHAALLAAGNEIWLEKAYLPGMAAIATGVLAALLAGRMAVPRRRVAIALCIVGGCGLCAVFFAGKTLWSLLHDGYMLVLTGASASIVLGSHWLESTGTAGRPMRSLRWLRSCGRLSYEIYLFHMFCIFAVLGIAQVSGLSLGYGFIWYPLAIGLSWLLGLVIARAFSEPCDRWLRRKLAVHSRSRPAPVAELPS